MSSGHLFLTIEEMCNTGSFASIYRANHHSGERTQQVALKILKEQWLQDQEQIHRFWDEAQLLTKLNHPNVVKAKGICEFQGLPAILMDFIDGFDLKFLLQHPEFRFSAKMAFEIACTVTKTLDEVYYHSQNQVGDNLAVLHRDIKPANVMLNRHGLVQVLDFGASRFENEERMGATNLYEPGTQKYSPPDRRLGERGNHKGDIFAVGLLLIELLSNQLIPMPPLQEDEYQRFLHEHIEALNFAMPNQQWASSVKQTLYRMCAYSPEDRLNAKQAVHMLEPYASRAQGASIQQVVTEQFPRIPNRRSEGQWSGQSVHVQLVHSLYSRPDQSAVTTTEQYDSTQTDSSAHSRTFSTPLHGTFSGVLSHRLFWRNALLSGSAVFFFLHSLTWILLSDSPSPETTKAAVAPEATTDLISLTVEKKDLAVLELLNANKQRKGKLTRSKSEQQLQLPKGKYTVSAKIFNHSAPVSAFSFTLEEESTLTCRLEKEKPRCQLEGQKP